MSIKIYVNTHECIPDSISIQYLLNGIDTCTFVTDQKYNLFDMVDISNRFKGIITNIRYDNITQIITYEASSNLYFFTKKIFTQKVLFDTQDFLSYLSTDMVKLANYNLDQDDLGINIKVTSESYFSILKRLSEIKKFSFWYDYTADTVLCGTPNIQHNIDFEAVTIEVSNDQIFNKIYPFSDEYNTLSVSSINKYITQEDGYLLQEDEKGIYILARDSANQYGILEIQETVNDFDINNVDNNEKKRILNSIYTTALNRLKNYSIPESSVVTNSQIVEINDVIDISKILRQNGITYYTTQLQLVYNEHTIEVQPTFESKETSQVGILYTIRRLDRESRRKVVSEDTIIIDQSVKLKALESKTLEVQFPTEKIVNKCESYYTIQSDVEGFATIDVTINGLGIFNNRTVFAKSQSVRQPEIENLNLIDLVGNEIDFSSENTNELVITNRNDYTINVRVVFLIQVKK
jgi:hypothetical protein